MPSLGLGDAFDTNSGRAEAAVVPQITFYASGDEATDAQVRMLFAEAKITIDRENKGTLCTPVIMIPGDNCYNGISQIKEYLKTRLKK